MYKIESWEPAAKYFPDGLNFKTSIQSFESLISWIISLYYLFAFLILIVIEPSFAATANVCEFSNETALELYESGYDPRVDDLFD